MTSGIAVVESRWHGPQNDLQRNTTIRPFFEFLSDIHFGHHHGFEYEMVATRKALDEALRRLAWNGEASIAYLAMHGDETGLHLHGNEDQRVSRTHLKNTLSEVSHRSRLKGLFLGSCLFGTADLASYLLSRVEGLTWVAGYCQSVNFIQSTALDLLFFNTWLALKTSAQPLSERDRIEEVARRLRQEAPGLIRTPEENDDEEIGLGFSIFVRRRGPHANARPALDLLRERGSA